MCFTPLRLSERVTIVYAILKYPKGSQGCGTALIVSVKKSIPTYLLCGLIVCDISLNSERPFYM